MKLAEFVAYLNSKGLLDLSGVSSEENHAWFAALEVTQRHAFFAKFYGLDLGYELDDDTNSPRSNSLTLDFEKIDWENLPEVSQLAELQEEAFLDAVHDRSDVWFYTVGEILLANMRYPDEEYGMMPFGRLTQDVIDEAYADIDKLKLLEKVKSMQQIVA